MSKKETDEPPTTECTSNIRGWLLAVATLVFGGSGIYGTTVAASTVSQDELALAEQRMRMLHVGDSLENYDIKRHVVSIEVKIDELTTTIKDKDNQDMNRQLLAALKSISRKQKGNE